MSHTDETTMDPTTVSPKHHYAAAWPRGRDPKKTRWIARFKNPDDRDKWVYEGHPKESRPDYRNPLYAHEIQADLRRSASRNPERTPRWHNDPATGIEFLD